MNALLLLALLMQEPQTKTPQFSCTTNCGTVSAYKYTVTYQIKPDGTVWKDDGTGDRMVPTYPPPSPCNKYMLAAGEVLVPDCPATPPPAPAIQALRDNHTRTLTIISDAERYVADLERQNAELRRELERKGCAK